eukprot:GHVU01102215.1.p5 GENE.GHVU01102215.1~~GHVU01102215.1.p5  ORF type:complete len:111 (+),score=5.93 GHVU01102215.1:809-1141(+)
MSDGSLVCSNREVSFIVKIHMWCIIVFVVGRASSSGTFSDNCCCCERELLHARGSEAWGQSRKEVLPGVRCNPVASSSSVMRVHPLLPLQLFVAALLPPPRAIAVPNSCG